MYILSDIHMIVLIEDNSKIADENDLLCPWEVPNRTLVVQILLETVHPSETNIGKKHQFV